MQFPKEWVKASRESARGDRVSAWGWGETREEAERTAADRLTRVLDRLEHGDRQNAGYPYGVRPVREAIVEVIAVGEEGPTAVITRNQYGALVLNTSGLCFIDIDVPEPSFRERVGALFGRPSPRTATLDRIRAGLAGRGWGTTFRLYETAAGFRVLGVDRELDPSGPDAAALMAAVGADPAYLALCRSQRSYRARLTPKPWRCGLLSPPPGLQPGDPPIDDNASAWLASYDAARAAYATCRFVETIGAGRIAPSSKRVVGVHDDVTRAESGLPLA